MHMLTRLYIAQAVKHTPLTPSVLFLAGVVDRARGTVRCFTGAGRSGAGPSYNDDDDSRSSSSMMEPSPLLQRHHELQGPRPASLKVSSTLNKRRRRRLPVIIYVESPRVVHAHPAEFKSVVQRLTGAPAAPRPSPPNTMVFSAPSAPPPLQLQFPFPLVGAAAGSALLPLTSSIMSSSVTVADASGSSSVGHENLSSDPFLLPLPSSSLAAAFYHHQQQHGGDLFIAHHQ